MKRKKFIECMGAAALIPFFPTRFGKRTITSTITLVTEDHPINYRTVVHAYDVTLETVIDEYTPFDEAWLANSGDFVRTMTLSDLPDNYDKYELSVWRTERIGQIAVVQPVKVFSRTYNLGFPTEVFIDLK